MGGEKRDHSRQAKRLQLPMVILNPVDNMSGRWTDDGYGDDGE